MSNVLVVLGHSFSRFAPFLSLSCIILPTLSQAPDLDLSSSEGRKSWFVSKISGKHPHRSSLGVHGVAVAQMLSLNRLWLREYG